MTYWEQLQKRPANDVPLMTSNTKDESGAAYGTNTTVAQYAMSRNSTYGDFASRFLQEYTASYYTQASMDTNLVARDASNVGSWNFGRRPSTLTTGATRFLGRTKALTTCPRSPTSSTLFTAPTCRGPTSITRLLLRSTLTGQIFTRPRTQQGQQLQERHSGL